MQVVLQLLYYIQYLIKCKLHSYSISAVAALNPSKFSKEKFVATFSVRKHFQYRHSLKQSVSARRDRISIEKAIKIVRSDDARDRKKKS